MKTWAVYLLLILSLWFVVNPGFCEEVSKEEVIFGFEEPIPNWEIPDWCFEKEDYTGESIAISNKVAREGKSSLEVMVNFPDLSAGRTWTAAYMEIMQSFDWTPYKSISLDVFLPKGASFGYEAKIILTVGEDWSWTEMSYAVKLVPGEWTTITALLLPGTTDWRRTQVTDSFRADVRKLGVRIESNRRPAYSGPIYIDNVRLQLK